MQNVSEALLRLVVTVPAAAAVIVTAWMFLKEMRQLNGEWSKTVKELHEESRQCIRDNTDALSSLKRELRTDKKAS